MVKKLIYFGITLITIIAVPLALILLNTKELITNKNEDI